ncbi:MAG: hypothetical protein KA821_15490 [Chitinophagaceae bacterium]|nr:hypothetical protein [Chitinophagaceae bacterium]
MKYILTLVAGILCAGLLQAQKKFVNKNNTSNTPRVEVTGTHTIIYQKVGGQAQPTRFGGVPVLILNEDGVQKFSRTFTQYDQISKRTYEFTYQYGRRGDKAYLKLTIDYKDRRATKVIEEYFVPSP